MQAWVDDAQRMCDSTPRHRPLITPAWTTRVKQPRMTDTGLVAAVPGHLMVLTHSDPYLCVTVETYTRRPPVETKGWDNVVEVGYRSPTGSIVLRDSMIGTELPDLSLHGRAGDRTVTYGTPRNR
ncbi:hypothetical protein [Nonomuraea soli]|uniref:Uncharacterized protein n=1 Tax=Nonomuraea soli TaxID=1032476 RepID=A0A7W0HTW2_9ACTN|nr:hypothetical protein [Nonomuraea soli]MBA2895121.1 hypothetical protein [Nonomuraea soli]